MVIEKWTIIRKNSLYQSAKKLLNIDKIHCLQFIHKYFKWKYPFQTTLPVLLTQYAMEYKSAKRGKLCFSLLSLYIIVKTQGDIKVHQ